MIDSKVDGLMVVKALRRSAAIEANIPTDEIAAAVMSGVVVVVKDAFDPQEMRHLRNSIVSSNLPHSEPHFEIGSSWRSRREVHGKSGIEIRYEASFVAARNPQEELSGVASSTIERMASYWRTLTGYKHTFVAEPRRRALRTWAMYYPQGGGCFDWHTHNLESTKIGLIVAMTQAGVDFAVGGTEFETPFGMVDASPLHDIGDMCLFRYDLNHRVTPVDPDRELRWDGAGRWTLTIPVDPRPLEAMRP